ncbi:hypothetical protein LZ30DRAFT_697030 [Colletotrichum cereale]|nr:hypothetical protein LZ30DRAFT_697030 [Colletotrichum cereale]
MEDSMHASRPAGRLRWLVLLLGRTNTENHPSHRPKLGPPSKHWLMRWRSQPLATRLASKPIPDHRASQLSMHPRAPEISHALAAALEGFDTCASYPTRRLS